MKLALLPTLRLGVLPLSCLGGAALLLAPARPSSAFSTLGGRLAVDERDVRVLDNFADAATNDNVTPDPWFPGAVGAELAIWKAIVEWGSDAHGDGSGDSTQPQLGDGGANFDAFWAGAANEVGNVDSNIVSKVNSCSGGVLAYCESALVTGWRIRFCEAWTWSDGPGTIPNGQYDLQGVMVHEYGHALGLGHSNVSGATMWPSIGSGNTSARSISPDDIAGVQHIYGVRDPAKPTIVATVAQAGILTIHGTNFTPTNQVWFAPATPSGAATLDPRVVVMGVTSDGARITLAIPPEAGAGDVIVKVSVPGPSSLTNAFPTDLVGTIGDAPTVDPDLTSIAPAAIPALDPGTSHGVTLTGTDLHFTTEVLLDGLPLAPSRWVIVDPTTIAVDMPQVATLGAHTLAVGNGVTSDALPITLVANALPALQLASGDPFVAVDRDDGLAIVVAGPVGSVQRIYASSSSVPSVNAFLSLALGNGFTNLVNAGQATIPASGWLQINVPTAALPDPGAGSFIFYLQTVELAFPTPFDASNLQSMELFQ
jgi:hypothetical protein